MRFSPSRIGATAILVLFAGAGAGCTLVNKIRAKNELNETARSYREGRFEEAEQHAKRALYLDPNNKTAPIFIARVIHQQYKPGVDQPDNIQRAREAIEHLLPERGMRYRLARRRAGLGSLGRVRLVAIADWKGGRVAREAKALLRSALQWLNPERVPAEILYGAIPEAGGALSGSVCADARALDRAAAVAALFAHRIGCARDQPRGTAAA